MNRDLHRRRLLIGLACLPVGRVSMAAPPHGPIAVPSAYLSVAKETGVPPVLLYGVALQESAFPIVQAGERKSLPWPWTLNVAGRPARLPTRDRAEERLREVLRSGIRNVDVGPMQVNWRYHQDRLGSVGHALDPYRNLRVGADILAMHFEACRDWQEAVGRYHAPSNARRATRYAGQVFARLRRLGHV